MKPWLLSTLGLLLPAAAQASEAAAMADLTATGWGLTALALFVAAYALVPLENNIHLRKSKPVMLAAGVIWGLIGWVYVQNGIPHSAEAAVRARKLPPAPGVGQPAASRSRAIPATGRSRRRGRGRRVLGVVSGMEEAPGGEIDYCTPYGGFTDGGIIYTDEHGTQINTDEHR